VTVFVGVVEVGHRRVRVRAPDDPKARPLLDPGGHGCHRHRVLGSAIEITRIPAKAPRSWLLVVGASQSSPAEASFWFCRLGLNGVDASGQYVYAALVDGVSALRQLDATAMSPSDKSLPGLKMLICPRTASMARGGLCLRARTPRMNPQAVHRAYKGPTFLTPLFCPGAVEWPGSLRGDSLGEGSPAELAHIDVDMS
jgi:hypothetical protein